MKRLTDMVGFPTMQQHAEFELKLLKGWKQFYVDPCLTQPVYEIYLNTQYPS